MSEWKVGDEPPVGLRVIRPAVGLNRSLLGEVLGWAAPPGATRPSEHDCPKCECREPHYLAGWWLVRVIAVEQTVWNEEMVIPPSALVRA